MAVEQLIQIVGSLLILGAFILLQLRRTKPDAAPYLWINFIGASILAVTAILTWQWGFIILEAVWAFVALAGIIRKAFKTKTPS